MDWRHYVRAHLPPLAVSAGRETEIVDELAIQLESIYERERRGGATPEAAMAAAENEVPDWKALAQTLGAIEPQPRTHVIPGAPGGGFMTGLTGDIRHAWRSLKNAPAFTAVALLTLSLGLGLAAAAFSIVDAVLIKALPFPNADRLVLIHATVPPDNADTNEITYSDAQDLAATESFASLSIAMTYAGVATSLDPPERLEGYDISTTLFETLGVQPVVGRAFTAEEGEPGRGNVVILDYGFWQRLGGRTDIVGQSIALDEVPNTIIGVMPPNFRLEVLRGGGVLYRPVTREHFAAQSRAFRAFRAIGRLQPGTSITQANSVMTTVGSRLARDYPDTNLGRTFTARPLRDDVIGSSRAGLLMIAGLVLVVLLIAGVNLINLLVARALTQSRDIAVRGALGASRWRLARASIVEGTLLSGAGALLGAFVAAAIVNSMKTIPGITLPRLAELGVDWTVMLGLSAGAVTAAIAIGLAPFVVHQRLYDTAALRVAQTSPGGSAARIRSVLVVGQTALAFILLAAAALLAVSLQRVLALPSGFDSGVATMRVSVPPARYADRPATTRFFTQFIQELSDQAGIDRAGFVSTLPLSGNSGSTLTIQGREDIPIAQRPGIGWQWANATYFEAMGIPIVRGRGFTNSDLDNPGHVTLINETLARLHFGGEDPIGRRVYFGAVPASGVPEWHEIIGVIGDVRHRSIEGEPDARAYDLFGQHWGRTISLAVRSAQAPARVATTVRAVLGRHDPRLAVFAVRSTDDLISTAVTSRRLILSLVAAFAAIGLAVAVLGVYGIVAFLVAERHREIGVRVALGATAADIHRLVLAHGIKLIAAGLIVGAGGALALRSGIESQLFNTSPLNARALSTVAIALLFAATVPCLIVSRRATRIDPVRALRSE